MEKIRCPMCSKLNPASNETCQFCNARLKPLTAPPEGAAGSPADDLENLDWKNQLEGSEAASAGEESSTSSPEGDQGTSDLGDWLARLQEDTGGALPSQDTSKTGETPASGEDLPDWLQNVRAAATRDINEPPLGVPVINPAAGEDDAWLERLRSQKAEDPNPPETPDPSSPRVPPQEPDWLHAFPYQKDAADTENPDAPGYTGQVLPDWLAGVQPSAPAEEPASEWNPPARAEEPSEIPDWLGSESHSRPVGEESSKDPASQPAFEEGLNFDIDEPAAGKPDWLVELEFTLAGAFPAGTAAANPQLRSARKRRRRQQPARFLHG